MKIIIIIAIFMLNGANLLAQDVFQKELFSTNLVLKYRNEIDLTSQQVTDIKKIYDTNISSFNSVKWDLDAELVTLGKILEVSKINEKTALIKMEEILALENKLKKIRLKMLVKIKNKLNESQQEQLKSLRTEGDIKKLDLIIPVDIAQRVLIKVNNDHNNEKSPLYILRDKKGERVISALDVQKINPDNIESVSVYKDKSGVVKYGKKAKNGVVLITIKN